MVGDRESVQVCLTFASSCIVEGLTHVHRPVNGVDVITVMIWRVLMAQ